MNLFCIAPRLILNEIKTEVLNNITRIGWK